MPTSKYKISIANDQTDEVMQYHRSNNDQADVGQAGVVDRDNNRNNQHDGDDGDHGE